MSQFSSGLLMRLGARMISIWKCERRIKERRKERGETRGERRLEVERKEGQEERGLDGVSDRYGLEIEV